MAITKRRFPGSPRLRRRIGPATARGDHCGHARRSLMSFFCQEILQRRVRLIDLALAWFAASGIARAWLTTGPDTRTAAFYRRRGWEHAGIMSNGEIRFACDTACSHLEQCKSRGPA
jgi:hypothetical protein